MGTAEDHTLLACSGSCTSRTCWPTELFAKVQPTARTAPPGGAKAWIGRLRTPSGRYFPGRGLLKERLSAALEWNALAAYVGPVAMTAYRVRTSARWFGAARASSAHPFEAAVAAANAAFWSFNLVVTLGYVNVLPLLRRRALLRRE